MKSIVVSIRLIMGFRMFKGAGLRGISKDADKQGQYFLMEISLDKEV